MLICAVIAGHVVLYAITARAPHGATERPSFLLITVDTLRADHLGCYGYRRNTSPNIDALAADGLLFETAYSPSNWTLPSLTGLHTSLYPSEHGAVTMASRFSKSSATLAEHLRNGGYETIGVVSHYFASSKFGFDEGFEVFDQRNVAGHDVINSKALTETAVSLMGGLGDRPFFMWVHYFDPHYTYMQHEMSEHAGAYEGPLADRITSEFLQEHKQVLEPADIQRVLDVYDEEISFTDHWIGELLAALKDFGLDQRTLVVLTADHGEEFMEHGNFGHGFGLNLHDEVIGVPLVFGGALPAGLESVRVQHGVEVLDIGKTVLEAAGVRPEEFGGQDLLQLALSGRKPAPCYIEATGPDPGDVLERRVALIEGNLKLILDVRTGAAELYDLLADPLELENLAETDAETCAALIRKIQERRSTSAAASQGAATLTLDDGERAHLRALGYTGDDEDD